MRVVIGEDEALLREGLNYVLADAGFEVVGTAASAPELIFCVEQHRPDLVITDIRMPPSHTDDGLLAAIDIRNRFPATAVVVLSQYLQRRYALELLGERPSGVGYLLKQRITDVATFCADLERVGTGGTVLDPDVIELMLTRAAQDNDVLAALTARQHTVLALMAEGHSNAAIARVMSLAEKSVVRHVSNVYEVLGLAPSDDGNRRVLAVVRYLSRSEPRR